MQQQFLHMDQSSDLLDLDIFLSVDLFDELMRSLATTYSRLWFYEQKKPVPNLELLETCYQRHSEILILKESFPVIDHEERNKAIDSYSLELKQVRILLQRNQELAMDRYA